MFSHILRDLKLECRVTKKIETFCMKPHMKLKDTIRGRRGKGEGGMEEEEEEEKLHSWYLKYGNYHMANRIPAVTPGFVRNLMNCKKPLSSF